TELKDSKGEKQQSTLADKKKHEQLQAITKRKAKGVDLNFQEKVTAFSIRSFRNLAASLEKTMPTLGEDLLTSNYFVSPQAFLSLILFATILSVPIAVIGIVLTVVTANYLFVPLAVVPFMVFAVGLSLPKTSRSSRGNAIDGELAFVIGYLSVLISGGIAPIDLFRRLSTSKLYPASAKEARRILLNVDVLAMDPVSAIERAARYTPNKMFSDFLSGYIAVLKIGGDIRSFMEQKQKEVFNHRGIKLKAATDFVGTLAEAYLAATVVMGSSLFILQIVSAMVLKGDINFNMMYFYAGVFMPMISAVMIFLLHSIQVKEPLARIRHHIVFLAGLAAVPLMLFVVPLDQPSYVKLAVGLAISTTPPAILSAIESKRKMAVERMMPSFVLDLAEIRKTGLAPEKCIEQLATRNYGELSKQVRRMATQVSWGVPLSKVLKDFGRDLNSWFVSSIGFILLEVVEVGGGTTGLFTGLADFTQRSRELEKERKSMFRPYIFMPYIGAVLTIASTVLIITLMTTQLNTLAANGTGIVTVKIADTKMLTEVMLMAAVFQGWLMGIVGGKMAEWSIGAGYKHATALAIICVMTAYLITAFVRF
ncbi:MAG: type II secretion system F family protein, partial [Nitrososphaera sp.]